MLDVVNGEERARAWPKKRSRKKHPHTVEQNEWFRQAQWATKYMSAEMYWQFAQAVKGTPLLPRDILTMMMAGRLAAFTLPSGRTLWSEQVANDVSQALDVISDQPGSMLVRGPNGWMAISPGLAGQLLTFEGPDAPPSWQNPVGPSGGTIITGAGIPDNSQGDLGQFYLDTVGQDLYGPKVPVAPPVVNQRYWGFVVEQCVATQIPSCAELQFFDAANNPIVPVSAAMIQQNPTYPASNMIDGNLATFGLSRRSNLTPREIFWVDFGANRTPHRCRWYRRNDSFGYNEAPLSVSIYAGASAPVSPWTPATISTRSLSWGGSHGAGVAFNDITNLGDGVAWPIAMRGA